MQSTTQRRCTGMKKYLRCLTATPAFLPRDITAWGRCRGAGCIRSSAKLKTCLCFIKENNHVINELFLSGRQEWDDLQTRWHCRPDDQRATCPQSLALWGTCTLLKYSHVLLLYTSASLVLTCLLHAQIHYDKLLISKMRQDKEYKVILQHALERPGTETKS